MTDCVLHIGLEKTGSTSLQATLAKNRSLLGSHGILYPASLGERNHVRAYMYASESGPDPMKVQFGLTDQDSLADFRATVSADLAREVSASQPLKLCISNEHCSSRLLKVSEIKRLQELIEPFCDKVTVVVYLRAQGDMLLSSYSTYLKTGGTRPFGSPNTVEMAGKYDHEAILERWSSVFGENALDVRLYERSNSFDVVADFIERLEPALNPGELDCGGGTELEPRQFGAEFSTRHEPNHTLRSGRSAQSSAREPSRPRRRVQRRHTVRGRTGSLRRP